MANQKICFDCGKPAKFEAKGFDGHIFYLCEKHAKVYIVPKMTELKTIRERLKSLFHYG